MSEKPKNNPISFRLNDEDNERLESLANSSNVPKSTMAANIVENVLNENMQEFQINHISYPRPIIKKLFAQLTIDQLQSLAVSINDYNREIIKSAKRNCPPSKIMNSLKMGWKSYGCEIRTMSFQEITVLEIHHEMEKNWSKMTCTTTSFILEMLDFKVKFTTVEDDWFKVEYSTND